MRKKRLSPKLLLKKILHFLQNQNLPTRSPAHGTVLPAQSREGYVKIDTPSDRAMFEQPQFSALPGGVFVECCLVTLPRDRPHKLPVWMRNKNEHDVTLPSNCIIAELHTTKEIYDNLPDLDKPADTVRCCAGISKPAKGPDQSDFTNDFGYSLFSKEWKDRATCSLYCVVLWCFCLQWDWFWACNQSQTPYKSERQRTIQAKVPTNPPKWLWNCEEALVNTLKRRGDSRVRVSLRFPNCSGL